MKKLNNVYNLKIFFPILLLILSFSAILFFFLSSFLFPSDQLDAIEKKEDWLLYSESQPDAIFNSNYVNYIPNIKANETLVMEREMTSDHQDPTLLLIGDHQDLVVFLDGTQLFANAYEYENFPNSHPGKTLFFVTLPQDYTGKMLRIYVTSPFQSFAGYPAEVYLGTANSLIGYIFKHSIPNIFILLFTGLVCILNLLYATFSYFRDHKIQLSPFLFSGFALSAGLEAGFGAMLGRLLFSANLNSTMLNLLTIITPMFLIGFYFSKMDRGRKYFGKWVLLHYSVGSFVAIWGIVFTNQLPIMMNYIFLLNIVSTFITAFMSIYEAVRKNQFFVLCAPWIVLAAIGHCFLHIQNVLNMHQSPTNWKVILFLMLVIVFTCYELLNLFILHNDKFKKMNLTRLKLRLYENKRLLGPQEQLDRSKLLKQLQQQTTTVKEMMMDQHTDAAMLYLDEMSQGIQDRLTAQRTKTEESLLSLLIANYQAKAAQKSIQIDLSLCPNTLNRLPEDHWLAVCIHLIELGLRQAYEIQDPKKRHVSLRTINHTNQMTIECCVHADDSVKANQTITSKEQIKQNEVDLHVLHRIVKEYHGTFNISDAHHTKKHVLTFQLNEL
ncbi:hypothetical protein IGI41_001711 [Enterococcus sp. DIV0876]